MPPLRYAIFPVFVVGATASTVYVLSYLPHFLWGWWHSPLDLVKYIFIKVPEYQAAVDDATHPYSSKWWTWPLLLRPVWYYWKDPGPSPGMVVGIWGSGNPPVWWAALPALVLCTYYAIRDRRLALVFVVAGWVMHLAPWVGIGRTLFLYHYLPSLLFGLLALSWTLDRIWHGEGGTVERGLIGAVLLTSLLPVAMATLGSWGPLLFLALLLGYEGHAVLEPGRPGARRTARGRALLRRRPRRRHLLPADLARHPRDQARMGGAHVDLGLEVHELDMNRSSTRERQEHLARDVCS